MIISITRKDLQEKYRDLPIKKLDISQVEDVISKRIRRDSTVVILLDDKKKFNKGVCSKVLRCPEFPNPNTVMTKEQYSNFEKRCKTYQNQQVARYLQMNRVSPDVINEYIKAVDKCGHWKPKI